ncbi:MAG: hypothetical protein RMY28_032115 [Nostoc sp. ChiSLP01]|nr:hypothetical protein [Nostoc sp. CmiSLP01]MDZ8288036.1 hypothetical protein [Nostoc sp. ChiSLP01]
MLVPKARNFASFLVKSIEYADNGYNSSRKLSQFINQCLQHRTYYSISFGDVGYSYEIGQTPAGDWIGANPKRI